MSRVLEWHEEWMGLPYPVVSHNAAQEVTDPDTGDVLGTVIQDTEELAAAVALTLCFMPQRLIGSEVRFIRRVLGMTGQHPAAAIEMDSATLSRWEHGRQEVGAWADKALRMAAVLQQRPEDVVTLRLHPRDPDERRWADAVSDHQVRRKTLGGDSTDRNPI